MVTALVVLKSEEQRTEFEMELEVTTPLDTYRRAI